MRLHGGLGNQFFQHAAGISVGRELDAPVVYTDQGVSRPPLSDLLDADVPLASPRLVGRLAVSDDSNSAPVSAFRYARRKLRVMRGIQPAVVGGAFTRRPPDYLGARTRVVDLTGYFQHPSWYEDVLPEVVEQVRSRLERSPAWGIGRGSSVVAFRRTSYLKVGWALSLDYYRNALESLAPIDGPVWVISDDPEYSEVICGWMQSMGVPAHPAPDVGEDEMIRDLCLLASARQVVMANSTFCWWGTVIGDADETATDRVVVAPDRWLPERFGAGDIMLRPGWRTVAISNGASAPFR